MTLQEEVDALVAEGKTIGPGVTEATTWAYFFKVRQFRQKLVSADIEMGKILTEIVEKNVGLTAKDHQRFAPIVFPENVMTPAGKP